MRVVLDTGILIAALISSNTPPDLIYRSWRKKRFELITSEWQLAEFRRVSRYPKVRRYLRPFEAGNLVNGLRNQAIVLGDLPEVDLSPDPDDNMVLASAIAGEVEYLVTGDKRDLFSLGAVQGVQIVTARDFAGLLDLSGGG